jgi:hypothetical protein
LNTVDRPIQAIAVKHCERFTKVGNREPRCPDDLDQARTPVKNNKPRRVATVLELACDEHEVSRSLRIVADE